MIINHEQLPQEILNDIRDHIDRLGKIILTMNAVSNIRYWYWCLDNIKKTDNIHDDFMRMEAFMTSIIISYGRLFGETTRTTQLKKGMIPKDLLEVHESIIHLRNNRYAHHGNHETIEINADIQFDGSSIIFKPGITLSTYLGAPKVWAKLFKHIDEYMFETLHKKLDFLTKLTGYRWQIPIKGEPYWIKPE